MKTKSLLVLITTLFSILCFAQDFLYEAQQQNQECDNATPNTIQLIQFDTGPFVQGGNVAVFFDPQGIYEIDNFFILELSDETGDFTSPTVLSQKEEFFLPVMNGVIPSTTTVGTSYKLRVRSTNPAVELIIPNSFEVIEDSSFNLQPGSVDFIENSFTNTTSFIKCVDLPNGDYFFGKLDNGINAETPSANPIELQLIGGSDVDTQIRILSQGIWQNLPINFGQFAIPGSLPVGYYPIEIKRTFNSGTVNEYHLISGFIFLFNTGNTGIGNTSAEEVCVGEIVEFQVQSDLISSNYPGSLYSIDYGDSPDGTNIEYYTHARFQICNQLNHIYDTATCSSEWQDLNSGDYFYKLDFKLLNKGIFDANSNSNEPIYLCNEYSENGNGTTKWINVSLQPTVDFTTQEIICAGTPIVATDTSISGAFGLGSSCETDYDRIWKIKRPGVSTFTTVSSSNPFFDGWVDDLNGTLTIPASETSAFPGCYSVRLVINNPEGCIVEDTMTKIVVIEPAPISSFTYTPTVDLCAPITIEFTNTSNTENFSDTCGNPSYTWTVTADTSTPATSDGFGIIDADENDSVDAQNQTDVDVIFTQPGTYVVNLLVENTCGINESFQEIVIIGDPTVEFNPNVFEACQESPANYTLDFSEPNIAPTYSTAPFTPASYFWEVFTADGVTPATNYSFLDVNGSTLDYPQINFTEFGTYVIKVSVDGNCGSSSFDTLQFSLKQTPIITNTDVAQAICSGDDTQEVVFTSDMNTTTYSIEITADPSVGGYDSSLNSGTGIPVMTLTNSSNIVATLTYTVTPSVNNCDGTPLAFVYTVNPTPVIPNQTTAICSEETFVINPTNAPPNTIVPSGTTYVWTVADNANVTGEASESSPQTAISQQLINTTNTVQTVIYTVIPTSGADGLCVGDEFTVTVDVNPKPSIEDITPPAICSGNSFSETPTNGGGVSGTDIVPSVTTYTWTVVDSSGQITGDSDQSTPQTSIGQSLTNTSNIPQTVVYTVVPTSGAQGNCEGDPFTITVVVNPTPVIPNQTTAICSEE
ncbi:MAG: PKD-like domain-containing protein, partial [Flavobacteriaceae bacterium]